MLFFQQAIRGTVQEFQNPEGAPDPWPLVNGLWSLFLAWGVLLTSLQLRNARSWRFLRSGLRSVLADYGAVVMVVAWSGLSFAVSGYPGVPVRLSTPNTWQVTSPWLVAQVRVKRGLLIACLLAAALGASLPAHVTRTSFQCPAFGLCCLRSRTCTACRGSMLQAH